MKYEKYWDRRWRKAGKAGSINYVPRVDVIALDEFIRKLMPLSVLEIGSGAGRMLDVLSVAPKVVMTDFSETAISKSNEPSTIRLDITSDVLDDTFDLIVSTQVLLHIPPKLIKNAFANMFKMTKAGGHWWHCVYYDPDNLSEISDDYLLSRNSFSHPIPTLMTDIGLTLVSTETLLFDNGRENTIFIAERKQ